MHWLSIVLVLLSRPAFAGPDAGLPAPQQTGPGCALQLALSGREPLALDLIITDADGNELQINQLNASETTRIGHIEYCEADGESEGGEYVSYFQVLSAGRDEPWPLGLVTMTTSDASVQYEVVDGASCAELELTPFDNRRDCPQPDSEDGCSAAQGGTSAPLLLVLALVAPLRRRSRERARCFSILIVSLAVLVFARPVFACGESFFPSELTPIGPNCELEISNSWSIDDSVVVTDELGTELAVDDVRSFDWFRMETIGSCVHSEAVPCASEGHDATTTYYAHAVSRIEPWPIGIVTLTSGLTSVQYEIVEGEDCEWPFPNPDCTPTYEECCGTEMEDPDESMEPTETGDAIRGDDHAFGCRAAQGGSAEALIALVALLAIRLRRRARS